MAVDITITGLTAQQNQDIVAAFVATQGPPPEGMSNVRFSKLCLLRFIKAVVKGWKRDIQEAVIRTESAQVDTDYTEDIA
jgi:hypothetical protein